MSSYIRVLLHSLNFAFKQNFPLPDARKMALSLTIDNYKIS